MAEKGADKKLNELKKVLKGKGIIIGAERTLKYLKTGKIKKVYLSSNCPEDLRASVEHYSKLSKASVVKLDCPNDELGMICKKQFPISVLSVIQ